MQVQKRLEKGLERMKRKQKRHLRKRPYIKQIFALFVCFVLTSSNIPSVAAMEMANNRTVKAGVFFFDGYHMRDSNGVYTGYGIELLNLISQYSHLNFVYTGYDKSWEEMLDMLERGEIDVVTSARKTRERTEKFAFSLPIERNSTVLSIQEQNTKIHSGNYSTYNGMTVGLLSGSSQNQSLFSFAQENGFTYQPREYDDPSQLESDLQNGTIDAILTSSLRQAENEKILDTIEIDYFYAITRKDDQELLDEINYAIDQMNINEGDWANVLYYKYYGNSNTSSNAFTQRELDYIQAVASGEKHITATSMSDRKPYSFVEDGELKGILPEFFDSLMKMAGLPYEMIVPEDKEEYNRLKANGGVDVLVDWQQFASTENEYADNGFLTNAYLTTGTALLTRKPFSGSVTSLAVTEGQERLPLAHEQFKNARILSCPTPEDALHAVLDGETDAAFVRTYAAQYFVNNDHTNSLQFNMIDSEQIVFNMFIRNSSDHELITILNKCIHQVPDDVLSQLITKYTADTPENVTFIEYMSVHPEMVLLLSGLVALTIGIILFLHLRSRWNKKLLRTTEQAKQELEEQLAIVSALSRDYLNVYTLNMHNATIRIVKLEGYLTPGLNQKSKEEYPYSEVLHQYIENRVLENDKEYLTEALSLERVKEALASAPEYIGTYHVQIGEEIHDYQFTYVPYQTEGQTDPLALVGFRNIDEIVRKEQEQKVILEDALHMAQAANEAKTSFLNSISHDIRTPMNAIIGFTALASTHIDNRERVMDYLGKIGQSSNHLLSLINDILDMSRIESGKMDINEKPENLAEILHSLRDIIQADIHSKQLEFFIDTVDVIDENIYCDRLRLNQVLLNILSNAIKFTPPSGTVSMRITERAVSRIGYASYEFCIKDTGLGMSAEFIKTIFEPFTRERSSTVSNTQGTGLGMAITKSIVDMMGGTIKVHSEEGKGSHFTVTLDLRLQEEQREAPRIERLVGLRGLVVDDDINTCQSVAHMLRQIGMRSEWTMYGKEAVIRTEEALKLDDQFHVYIIDWLMPDLNGIETVRRIRQVVGDNAPIIILSAYDWADIEEEARKAGVTDFVSKPLFLSDLHRVLLKAYGDLMEESTPEPLLSLDMDFQGRRILLVEDNELNKEIAEELLYQKGFLVETVWNGREAVDAVQDKQPGWFDLVLMDVQMPVMDGYEATRQIRALPDPVRAHVPILAMTANAFSEDRQTAAEAGMDGHVGKPIDIPVLLKAIHDVLAKNK